MNFHAFKQWVRYRWHAKTRHGVHSPFVYDLADNVIRNRHALEIPAFANNHRLEHKYLLLVARMMRHYDIPASDIILITEAADRWNFLLEQQLTTIGKNAVVIIEGIHKTERNTLMWNQICRMPGIPVSIDLYGIGLLFFKDEFREKQHFVLKY